MRYVIYISYNSNRSRELMHFSNKREKNLRNIMPYIIIITELCTYKYCMSFAKKKKKKYHIPTKTRKFIVLNTFAIKDTIYMLKFF